MIQPHTCHKCGGDGICLGTQEVGYSTNQNYLILHDFECDNCEATWDVTFELTPTERDNHE